MRGLGRAAAVALVALSGLALAGGAQALSISSNPVSFDNGSVSGTITLVGTTTGTPSGATVLGSSPGAGDISLIFEATLDAGSASMDEIGVGVLDTSPFGTVSPTGAGVISATGDQAITGLTASGATRIFEFAPGTLDGSETSQQFFVSYASLETDGSQNVNFMISPADGTSDFTESAVLVPEPGLAALALGGLLAAVGLGARRRR